MAVLLSGQWLRDAHSIVGLVPREHGEKSKLRTVGPKSAVTVTTCGEGAHGTGNTPEAKHNIPLRLHPLAWLAGVVLADLALRVSTVVLRCDTYAPFFWTVLLAWSIQAAAASVVATSVLNLARATARLLNYTRLT